MPDTKKQEKTTMLKALKKLRDNLRTLGPIPYNVESKKVLDPKGKYVTMHVPRDNAIFDYAVKFFNTMVQFQDEEVFKSDLFPNDSEVWNSFIKECGRSKDGIVRSHHKGIALTKTDLWLYIPNYSKDTLCMVAWEEAWKKNPEKEEYNKEKYQLWMYYFMENHIDTILPWLDEILQQNKENIFQTAKSQMNRVVMSVCRNMLANKR